MVDQELERMETGFEQQEQQIVAEIVIATRDFLEADRAASHHMQSLQGKRNIPRNELLLWTPKAHKLTNDCIELKARIRTLFEDLDRLRRIHSGVVAA